MTTIVVGGHSRKVGKTSVTEGLIRAFAGYPWTALKISSHWHSGGAGHASCVIHEEGSRKGDSDSSRFLAAGAARSFWAQVREEQSSEAMSRLLPIFQSSPFLIIESNWILRHLQPDLYILVLRYSVGDFKQSARETVGRADALLTLKPGEEDGTQSLPPWSGFVQQAARGVPVFSTADPLVIPPGLLALVRSKL